MKAGKLIVPLVLAGFCLGGYSAWRWGLPALMRSQHFSGSRAAPESQDWPWEKQMLVSEERARVIRDAVVRFREARGTLPQSLDQLVPEFLGELPVPATTTMPYEFFFEPNGNFTVRWEPWPNTMYERYWVDQDGKRAGDT